MIRLFSIFALAAGLAGCVVARRIVTVTATTQDPPMSPARPTTARPLAITRLRPSILASALLGTTAVDIADADGKCGAR
jgi:hypothetical protein